MNNEYLLARFDNTVLDGSARALKLVPPLALSCPLSVAHLVNHPPGGMRPNVLPCPVDFDAERVPEVHVTTTTTTTRPRGTATTACPRGTAINLRRSCRCCQTFGTLRSPHASSRRRHQAHLLLLSPFNDRNGGRAVSSRMRYSCPGRAPQYSIADMLRASIADISDEPRPDEIAASSRPPRGLALVAASLLPRVTSLLPRVTSCTSHRSGRYVGSPSSPRARYTTRSSSSTTGCQSSPCS